MFARRTSLRQQQVNNTVRRRMCANLHSKATMPDKRSQLTTLRMPSSVSAKMFFGLSKASRSIFYRTTLVLAKRSCFYGNHCLANLFGYLIEQEFVWHHFSYDLNFNTLILCVFPILSLSFQKFLLFFFNSGKHQKRSEYP